MSVHSKGILYSAITALCWGLLAIGLKVAVQEFNPVTLVWMRFFIAFLILLGWQLYRNPASLKIMITPPLLLVVATLALAWNYYGFMWGVFYTTPSNAQLFIQFGPMLLALSGLIIFKERFSLIQGIGFAIALTGFAFFYADQLSAFFDGKSQYNLGVILTLSGATAWTVYAILQKLLIQKYSASALNLFLFGFPSLLFLPFIDLSPILHLGWEWWLLILFIGANTFISYTTLAEALGYLEASKVSVIIFLNPIITFTLMGILTFMEVDWIIHERFSPVTILGATLVIGGAFLVVRKKSRKTITN
ncbi:MAG TPA: DMT family transporter [Mariniphaga sp.]|nr:DMT family transporter [Mariniphaga sp.]